MKNEKGITLIALIIYVILMTFVVAGVSTITASFYSNLNANETKAENAVQFAKFNMYFIKDIKSKNVRLVSCSGNKLILSYTNSEGRTDTITYSVQNNILYRDKIKICDKVKDARISGSGKQVSVYLKIDNYEKTSDYILEPKK